MQRRYIALGFSAMLVLGTACSGSEPFEPTVMPTVAKDAAVTDLLPIGPHQMNLEFTIDGAAGKSSVSVSGYIDLPEDYDLSGSCSYDLQATESANDGFTNTYVFKKAPGGQAWRRVETSDRTDVDMKVGEWFAGDDLEGPAPVILFPVLMLSDLGGGDYWCNMRRIDQVSVLADLATGRLGWAVRDFQLVASANVDAWYTAAFDAAGVSDAERDKMLHEFRDVRYPTFHSMLENSELEIGGDAEDRRFTVYSRSEGARKPMVEISFTPTQERQVDDVVGAKTYFEKLADGDVELLP